MRLHCHAGVQGEAAGLGHLSESVVFRCFGEQGLQGEDLLALLRAEGDTVGNAVPVHLLHGLVCQMIQSQVTVLAVLGQHALLHEETGQPGAELLQYRFQIALGRRIDPAEGLPRVSDGSLLFLLHLVSKMRDPRKGGSRIGIILNGSPLFTGGAGSGESEIRRYLLQNDHVEAIVALPTDMFYNTGISTYIWVLNNNKPPERKGKVQLIDGTKHYSKMRKSLGSKRQYITEEQIEDVVRLYGRFEEAPKSKNISGGGFRLQTHHRRATTAPELPGYTRADRELSGRKSHPEDERTFTAAPARRADCYSNQRTLSQSRQVQQTT